MFSVLSTFWTRFLNRARRFNFHQFQKYLKLWEYMHTHTRTHAHAHNAQHYQANILSPLFNIGNYNMLMAGRPHDVLVAGCDTISKWCEPLGCSVFSFRLILQIDRFQISGAEKPLNVRGCSIILFVLRDNNNIEAAHYKNLPVLVISLDNIIRKKKEEEKRHPNDQCVYSQRISILKHYATHCCNIIWKFSISIHWKTLSQIKIYVKIDFSISLLVCVCVGMRVLICSWYRVTQNAFQNSSLLHLHQLNGLNPSLKSSFSYTQCVTNNNIVQWVLSTATEDKC